MESHHGVRIIHLHADVLKTCLVMEHVPNSFQVMTCMDLNGLLDTAVGVRESVYV